MIRRLINTVTWLLVAGSVAIILGGLTGRPILLAAVPTPSMSPVMNPGDMIPVLPFWGSTLKIGQIVVFRTEADVNWIVHRVVGGSLEEGFITKGDANPEPDPNPVYPRHVVGIVPQIEGAALRIPRLGLLSLERSPLSNPLVAGIALIIGIYLMASDARAGLAFFRGSRLRRMPSPGIRPRIAVSLYAGMGLAIFLISLLTMWSLGSLQVGSYQVVLSRPDYVNMDDVLVSGQTKREVVTLKNPSVIPLVIGLQTSDPTVTYSPAWLMLWPHSEDQTVFTMTPQDVGRHEVTIRQSVLLPLLPLPVLRTLAGIDWRLPLFLAALMPTVVILAIAASDHRVRSQFGTMWLRIDYWLRG